MKARVKATGEIVEVIVKEIPQYSIQGENTGGPIEYLVKRFYDGENYYRYDELNFDIESFDYWTRLEHQYAGMAMQGMMNNSYLAGEFRKDPNNGIEDMSKIITKAAAVYAHALVEKLKEKEERK